MQIVGVIKVLEGRERAPIVEQREQNEVRYRREYTLVPAAAGTRNGRGSSRRIGDA